MVIFKFVNNVNPAMSFLKESVIDPQLKSFKIVLIKVMLINVCNVNKVIF